MLKVENQSKFSKSLGFWHEQFGIQLNEDYKRAEKYSQNTKPAMSETNQTNIHTEIMQLRGIFKVGARTVQPELFGLKPTPYSSIRWDDVNKNDHPSLVVETALEARRLIVGKNFVTLEVSDREDERQPFAMRYSRPLTPDEIVKIKPGLKLLADAESLRQRLHSSRLVQKTLEMIMETHPKPTKN